MIPLSPGVSFLDLGSQRHPRIIATAVLQTPAGVALVDPGPSSTLPALRDQLGAAGISVADLTAILLTHIHLDHAGSSGTLVRENPRLRVHVHERGAPHMVEPSKLLASAARLYGDAMDSLWGEFLAVPADAIVSLQGGERLQAGGHLLEVAYTPGHASHHVSYFSPDTGMAFVGDTSGLRLAPGSFVLPPTPPPDIDLELWNDSLKTIEGWRPKTLFLTHFGPSDLPGAHLAELRANLEWIAGIAKTALARQEGADAREGWFTNEVRRELCRRLGEAEADAYAIAGRFDMSWRGLARYWRKRSDAGASSA